jgi:replicative DNA helicase
MGKTALAISLANNLRRQKIITDIYSFESPYKTVIMRFMSQDLGIPLTQLRQGKIVDWLKVKDYGEELKIAGISIEDTARMNGEELEVRMRMRARNDGVQVVIIDYMQLMHMRSMNKNANREQEITAISRIIKTVAMETDTAMVPLSQLSRTVETRGGDKRPQLSDLRESGSIEQDADSVWFIYRPEYYKIMQDANGYSTHNVGIIDVAKNRNGETKDHEFLYTPALMKFEEWPSELNKKYEPNADGRKGKKKRATDISRRDYTEAERDDDSPPTEDDPLPF